MAGEAEVAASSVEAVREVVRAGLERLAPRFPGTPTAPFRVVVHRSRDSLPPEVARFHHAGSPGLALLDRHEIHLLLRETAQAGGTGLTGVVDHELVHILLHQYAGPCADRLPRWFHEGLAQVIAGDTYLGASEEELVWRARANTMMRWTDLQDGFPDREDRLRQAYGQSYSFVAYLERTLGLPTLLAATRRCPDDLEFEGALVRTTGQSMVAFDEQWRDYLVRDSGAAFRVLANNCFSYLVILAVPFLALAVIRKLRSDSRAAVRMARQEEDEQEHREERDDPPADDPEWPGPPPAREQR